MATLTAIGSGQAMESCMVKNHTSVWRFLHARFHILFESNSPSKIIDLPKQSS